MNFSHFTGKSWIMTMITAAAVGNITVIQSPEILSKEPGETARLGCWYQGPSVIGGYTWYRGGIAQGREVSNNTPEFRGRVAAASQEDFRERRDASIRIIDLKAEDTGFYICKIVLVGVGDAYGTGTTVVVTSGNMIRNKEGTVVMSDVQILWCVRAAVVTLLGIGGIFGAVCFRRKSFSVSIFNGTGASIEVNRCEDQSNLYHCSDGPKDPCGISWI